METLGIIDRMGVDIDRLRRAERQAEPDVALCERVVHTLLPDVESIRKRLEKMYKESWADGFARARASLEISFCVHCGRVYVVDQKDTQRDACDCGQELYPVGRRLMLESELKAGDDHSLRVVGAAACKENATMETKRSGPGQVVLVTGTALALRAAARWSAPWRRGIPLKAVEMSFSDPVVFLAGLRTAAEKEGRTLLIIDEGTLRGDTEVIKRGVDAVIHVRASWRNSADAGHYGFWRAEVTQDRIGSLPLEINFSLRVDVRQDKPLMEEWG